MGDEVLGGVKKKGKPGRPKGSLNKKTLQIELGIDPKDLNPPPLHEKGTPWSEEQAVEELEFLIRFLDNMDYKKIFFGQCLSIRGYRDSHLYENLAKKFPASCLPLYDFAKMIQQNKLATMTLTKHYDSRFGVFAMQNISQWRQTQTLDVATNVSIKTKDYKGLQPTINERIQKGKKGK